MNANFYLVLKVHLLTLKGSSSSKAMFKVGSTVSWGAAKAEAKNRVTKGIWKTHNIVGFFRLGADIPQSTWKATMLSTWGLTRNWSEDSPLRAIFIGIGESSWPVFVRTDHRTFERRRARKLRCYQKSGNKIILFGDIPRWTNVANNYKHLSNCQH